MALVCAVGFLLMLVLAGIGVLTSLRTASAVPGPDGPIPTADPSLVRPATIETAIEAAANRARGWGADARLFAVTAQFDFRTNPGAGPGGPVGGWLTFVFVRGKGGGTESLTLLFERNRAEIVRETTQNLGVAANSLDPDHIKAAAVDSYQALTIAEAQRGQAFRGQCLPSRHVARVAFDPGSGEIGPRWVVSYNDARVSNGPVLRVLVDAQTGRAEVSELLATNPPPDELPACSG